MFSKGWYIIKSSQLITSAETCFLHIMLEQPVVPWKHEKNLVYMRKWFLVHINKYIRQ